MTARSLYDMSVIKEILPHRSPFLFVDRIMELKAGEKIIAEKDILGDEFFFAGHFPGNPIMPGLLVSEALAQTSGLLLGLTWNEKGESGVQKRRGLLYLANINMKFSSPAGPEETLRLEAILKKEYGRLFLFDVAANVEDRPIAAGTLALAGEEQKHR